MIDPANHSKIEQNNEKALINEDATEISNEYSEPSEDQKGQLIKAETSETGHLKLKVYLAYFKSLGICIFLYFCGTYCTTRISTSHWKYLVSQLV